MKQHHVRPSGLPPVNGYSHVVVHEGRLVAVSGQVALDQDGNLVGPGDAVRQTEQVFRNMATALAAAGSGLDRLVKLTVFLTDRNDLDAYRRVRDRHIDPERPPASSLVLVAGLVHPGFLVEVDALADASPDHAP
jgi:enamine deaminase RidA (YjgF/YER057c/UK114 family)